MLSLRKLIPSSWLFVPRGHKRDRTTYHTTSQSVHDVASCRHFPHDDDDSRRRHSARAYPPNYLPLLFLLVLLGFYFAAVSFLSVDKASSSRNAGYAQVSERPLGGSLKERFSGYSDDDEEYIGAGVDKKYFSTNLESTRLAPVKDKKAATTKKASGHKGTETDYYALLGISHSATFAEIKAAYKKKTLRYQADKGGHSEDMDKLALIARAYEVLSGKEQKRTHDEKSKKNTEMKSGEDGVGSIPHRNNDAKKRSPHSEHSKKTVQARKSIRGNKSKRRKIPQGMESAVDSGGPSGAETTGLKGDIHDHAEQGAKKRTHDKKSKKKLQMKSGEVGSTPHRNTDAKKPSPHSDQSKKTVQPRKSIRGSKSKRRKIPQRMEIAVDSEGPSGAATTGLKGDIHDHAEQGAMVDAVVDGKNVDLGMEGSGVDGHTVSSTDDVIVGLAVVAAVALVALLGALAYISKNKGRQGADAMKRSNSPTERGSEVDSEDSVGDCKPKESATPLPPTKDECIAMHVFEDMKAAVQKSSTLILPSTAVFSVTVPDHVQPGQDFSVLAGDRVLCVKCPLTSKPGGKVQIFVEEDAPNDKDDIAAIRGNIADGARKNLESCNNIDVKGDDKFAKNPQEGTSTVFEVAVPKGVEPGQPFPVMVEGAEVVVTCPTDVSAGRKIVFQLPSEVTTKT